MQALAKLQIGAPGAFAQIRARLRPNRAFSLRDLDDILQPLIEQYTPSQDVNSGSEDTLPEIEIDPEREKTQGYFQRITEVFSASGQFYSLEKQLVRIRDGVISYVTNAIELAGNLANIASVAVVRYFSGKNGRTPVRENRPLPSQFGAPYLHSDFPSSLPPITLFTKTPTYDDEWNLVQPGYNKQSRVYYAGESIPPSTGTDHIDKMLQDFCFKSAVDRVNYIGILIDALLTKGFHGKRPMLTINANRTSVGKSKLAEIAAILREGNRGSTLSYQSNDEEFEKQIATRIREGHLTITVDNARSNARNPLISSSCLERTITAPIVSFRLLGASKEIRAPNSFLFVITVNNARLGDDLIKRSCPVSLYWEGDPDKRKFKLDDPVQFAEDNREAILAELLGMIERWKEAGQPEINVDFRFKPWARVIGGILAANGLEGFLSNLHESKQEYDPDMDDLVELAAACVDWEPMTAGDLLKWCDEKNVFQSGLGRWDEQGTRSRSIKLGNTLSRFIGEEIEIEDPKSGVPIKVVLHKETDGHRKQYRYQFRRAVVEREF